MKTVTRNSPVSFKVNIGNFLSVWNEKSYLLQVFSSRGRIVPLKTYNVGRYNPNLGRWCYRGTMQYLGVCLHTYGLRYVLWVEAELGWAQSRPINNKLQPEPHKPSPTQQNFQLYCDVCPGIPNPGQREAGIENAQQRGEGIPFKKILWKLRVASKIPGICCSGTLPSE